MVPVIISNTKDVQLVPYFTRTAYQKLTTGHRKLCSATLHKQTDLKISLWLRGRGGDG